MDNKKISVADVIEKSNLTDLQLQDTYGPNKRYWNGWRSGKAVRKSENLIAVKNLADHLLEKGVITTSELTVRSRANEPKPTRLSAKQRATLAELMKNQEFIEHLHSLGFYAGTVRAYIRGQKPRSGLATERMIEALAKFQPTQVSRTEDTKTENATDAESTIIRLLTQQNDLLKQQVATHNAIAESLHTLAAKL